MSLLDKLSKQSTKSPENYLSIVINKETVHSALWQLTGSNTKITNVGSHQDWAGEKDKLITATDTSLSTALEGASPEPDKAILGIPDSWVESDKIVAEKQALIKNLSNKLSLKPVGFVIIADAIINFIKQKEGTPPTIILLGLTESEVTVNLVKLGKNIGSHSVGRSDDLGADVEEGLARFKQEDSLPTRMVLYNGQLDLEIARQTLLSYAWQDKLPFLHFPKIDILDKDTTVKAVAIAGGLEMSSHHHHAHTPSSPPPPSPASVETKPQKQDIEDLGFHQDQDVMETKVKKDNHPTKTHHQDHQVDHSSAQRIEEPQHHNNSNDPGSLIKKITNAFAFISKLTSKINLKKLPPTGLIWIISAVVISAAAISAFLLVPKAQVTLYLTPKTIDKQIDFTVVSGKDTDIDRSRLKGEIVEVEVEDTLQKDTSGEALVGDKATGEVTIFNKTSKSKTFSSGTTLIGTGDLKFELDENVTIASQSASDSGITFGKTKVKATAVSVGTQSNISNNTTLSIKGFDTSDYSAKAAVDFSGGSSKQVRSVSQDDRDDLLEELTKKLEEKAAKQLEDKIDFDETLISLGFEQEEINKKYTKAIDEEADSVSLTLKLRLTTLKFKTEEALNLVKEDVDSQAPENFVSQGKETVVEILESQVEDGEAQVEAVLRTKLIPNLDEEEIKSNLKGKKPEATESYLKSLPNFSKVDIDISPKLPQSLSVFPRRVNNITLTIKVQEE